MNRRKLGNSEIEISPLVLGGNVFGWTVDEAGSFALLDAFLAAGFNCIDTADVYSAWAPGNMGGESETIIGNWLKLRGRRDKVVIATKVGSEMGPGRKGLGKDWIALEVENSLRRLRTDYIDLYQAHVDDEQTPLEETLAAFARLIAQGKVRAIGGSNYSAGRLLESIATSRRMGVPQYQSLQPLYNLHDRDGFEGSVQEACAEQGIGVITYYSLASGFLTGKYRSEKDIAQRARAFELKKYFTERGYRILGAITEVCRRLEVTPSQVALAWLLARPGVTAPIVSATTLDQLNEIVGATRVTLDLPAITLLDDASSKRTRVE